MPVDIPTILSLEPCSSPTDTTHGVQLSGVSELGRA